jgi:hypothetical protein
MRFSRQSIAAAATIAALGVLAAVALAGGETEPTTAPAPTAETDPAPQVRTEVIRRTVHRTASSDDDSTADQGPGDAPRTAAPAPSASPSGNDDRRGRDDDWDDSSGHGGDDDDRDDSSGHGSGDDDSSGHGDGDDSSGHGDGDD